MELEILKQDFSICKINAATQIDFTDEFCFIGKTDEELSLVCSTACVPKEVIECDSGWKGFRIQGKLDFSLTGILAGLTKILAENNIGIFAVSTYNTDYILVREKALEQAIKALKIAGNEIMYL